MEILEKLIRVWNIQENLQRCLGCRVENWGKKVVIYSPKFMAMKAVSGDHILRLGKQQRSVGTYLCAHDQVFKESHIDRGMAILFFHKAALGPLHQRWERKDTVQRVVNKSQI